MELHDWTKEFREVERVEDIPAEMQRIVEKWTTIKYFFTGMMALCLALAAPLAFVTNKAPVQGAMALLMFSALASLIGLAGARLRADIRLATLRLRLEWHRNITAELRKSEAEDL